MKAFAKGPPKIKTNGPRLPGLPDIRHCDGWQKSDWSRSNATEPLGPWKGENNLNLAKAFAKEGRESGRLPTSCPREEVEVGADHLRSSRQLEEDAHPPND